MDYSWLTKGDGVSISTRRLRRGCFYLCEPFYMQASECAYPKWFVKGNEILVPTIVKELNITPASKFEPLSECYSYVDLDDVHRFEYVAFLQGQLMPLVSNKALIEYYLRGIAIRLFLDNTTTEEDRVDIFERLLLFYYACSKYRKLIQPLLVSAFYRFFVEIDEGKVTFFPKSECVRTNKLIRAVSKSFFSMFPGSYHLKLFLNDYGTYSISGIDSQGASVVVEVPLPDEILNTPKIKTKLFDAYGLFAVKQRMIRDLENKVTYESKDEFIKKSLLGNSESQNKSLAIVRAYYNRVIDQNEYIITNYAEIVKSFGFTEPPTRLASDVYSDEILSMLRSWGFYTYPDLGKLNLALCTKSSCVLYKCTTKSQVQKTDRYRTLLSFIKLALYVVQEDEYNWNDVQYIKHVITKHSPNERTAKELVSVLLLSLKDIQRLNSLKQEVGVIEKIILDDLILSLKTLAYVDGEVTRERKEQLECLLPILGYNVKNLSIDLRRITPVDFSKKQPVQVSLDLSLLKKLQEDTVEAQNLLNEIFVDEANESAEKNNDSSHISLLKVLLRKEIWTVSEVKRLCQQEGILYGAFIEKVNDYAYSKVDDVVLEEDGESIYMMLQYKDMFQ